MSKSPRRPLAAQSSSRSCSISRNCACSRCMSGSAEKSALTSVIVIHVAALERADSSSGRSASCERGNTDDARVS